MNKVPFNDFLCSLSDFRTIDRDDSIIRGLINNVVFGLQSIQPVNEESLASYIASNPKSVPIVAMCIGLGQEQLKNQLKHRFNTTGWVTLAKTNSHELVKFFESEFNVISNINEQLNKQWQFDDVLLERHIWSRKKAVGAIGRGRGLEDEVESIVMRLGISYKMRSSFIGRGNETAPCDIALPSNGKQARIAIAVKSFNSTGSKLTDAVREIEAMVRVRTSKMYIYAVIDGIGWKNRIKDLKRIYELYEDESIDGLYNLNSIMQFEDDIRKAAAHLGLIRQ